MVFLHGFPEFWYSWRRQIVEFSKDHKVVAVDLRGFNDSDKPAEESAYNVPVVVEDIVGVVAKYSSKKGDCVLVGHDWGGIVAWQFAQSHPDLINKLVVLDAIHPSKLNVFAQRNWEQLRKSWYVFFLLLPSLPEALFAKNDYDVIDQALTGKQTGVKNSETFDRTDIELYKDAIAKPGALTAAINYYRNLPNYIRGLSLSMTTVPTLYLHGEHDAYAKPNSISGVEKYVSSLKVVVVPGSSHWTNQDAWGTVNREIRSFLHSG